MKATSISLVVMTSLALLLSLVAVLFFRELALALSFAILCAYILDPVADWLERKRRSRTTAVSLILTAWFVAITISLLIVIPVVLDEIGFLVNLIRKAPTHAVALIESPWVSRLLPHQADRQALTHRLIELIQQNGQSIAVWLSKFGGQLVAGFAGAVNNLLNLALVPVVMFFLLRDFDLIRLRTFELIPPAYQPWVAERSQQIDRMLSGFFRGQLLVIAGLTTGYVVGFSLAGVPLSLLVGFLAGVLSIVPIVGGVIGVSLAVILCLLHSTGIGSVIGVLLTTIVAQFLEGHFLTPSLVGSRVGLSPLTIILSVLIGAELMGLIGMIVAIPSTAVLKIFLADVVRWYRASDYYGAVQPPQQ